MKTIILLLLLSISSNIDAFAQKSEQTSNIRSLVEAESRFAEASVARGFRMAFIENLADDSILFRPRAVAGKKWMEEHTDQSGVLTWRPIFADVSRAGDLGYTTGPWEYREERLEDKPVAYGYFVTIWRRQADGVWKAMVDLGTNNPAPQGPGPELKLPREYLSGKNAKLKTDVAAARAALLQTEMEFSKLLTAKNTLDSYLAYLADDVRFYRTKAFPVIGRENTRAALALKQGTMKWQTAKADVAQSGDLGYSYGSYEFKAVGEGADVEGGNYLRIWRKQADGKWRIVLDLLNPIPPGK